MIHQSCIEQIFDIWTCNCSSASIPACGSNTINREKYDLACMKELDQSQQPGDQSETFFHSKLFQINDPWFHRGAGMGVIKRQDVVKDRAMGLKSTER